MHKPCTLKPYTHTSPIPWHATAGGLSENDFIVASKINDIPTKDIIAKKKAKYWA